MKNPAPATRAIIYGNVGVAGLDILLTLKNNGEETWVRQILSLSPANLLEGAWWEPLTYMWLHAPPIGFWVTHILFNMLTLSIFGKAVEGRIGSARFCLLYFVGGLAAAGAFLGQEWWSVGQSWSALREQTQAIVGASGAVLGVVAAFAVYFPEARLFIFPFPFPVRASRAVRVFILLSLAMMFVPALSFIGHSAHIGGLLAGFFLARAWWKEGPEPPVLSPQKQRGMEEMSAAVQVAGLSEGECLREVRQLLGELGQGSWRPLTSRERALLRRAHLLV